MNVSTSLNTTTKLHIELINWELIEDTKPKKPVRGIHFEMIPVEIKEVEIREEDPFILKCYCCVRATNGGFPSWYDTKYLIDDFEDVELESLILFSNNFGCNSMRYIEELESEDEIQGMHGQDFINLSDNNKDIN